jgi:4-hydroxybenzoate polyprenyltransferase
MMVLLEYAHERLMRAPVLAAILLVTAGAHAGRGFSTAAGLAADLTIACCLVVSFRVWDDVMDREPDRVRHPDRVLVRTRSTAVLSLAALGLATAGAIVLFRAHGAGSLWLLVVFSSALAAWYGVRGTRSAAGDRMLLFKYAVFTMALIGRPAVTPRGLASALGVYLAVCLYEWLHDRESPVFSLGGSR